MREKERKTGRERERNRKKKKEKEKKREPLEMAVDDCDHRAMHTLSSSVLMLSSFIMFA